MTLLATALGSRDWALKNSLGQRFQEEAKASTLLFISGVPFASPILIILTFKMRAITPTSQGCREDLTKVRLLKYHVNRKARSRHAFRASPASALGLARDRAPAARNPTATPPRSHQASRLSRSPDTLFSPVRVRAVSEYPPDPKEVPAGGMVEVTP